VFPFWAKRNFREFVRTTYDYPHCQRIEERWVAYFVWKSVGISHTIPDFKTILEKGTLGIIDDIHQRMNKKTDKKDLNPELNQPLNQTQAITLESMKLTLEGMNLHAQNLSETARTQAKAETDAQRRKELMRLADICAKVPMHPAETLDEAVNLLNISWIALNLENANTGFSLGRMDQLLQPYFVADMKKLGTEEAKANYIQHAIELVGCHE